MFNARSETVAEKPSFRNAFKRRRCLVPATGFYEWKSTPNGKQPYFCHLDHRPFCFAAIWEHWQDAAGNELQTCALLTTPATGSMTRIHQRMPVVLTPQDHAEWLDHRDESTDRAFTCMARLQTDFRIHPVSRDVNSARNDHPGLTAPLADQVDGSST